MATKQSSRYFSLLQAGAQLQTPSWSLVVSACGVHTAMRLLGPQGALLLGCREHAKALANVPPGQQVKVTRSWRPW